MNLHDFNSAVENFSVAEAIDERKHLYKLRKDFVNEYSLNNLKNLQIDDYVIGKNKGAFCYRLEQELDGLGRIKGSTAYKFGIYYGKEKNDEKVRYRFRPKWGNNQKEAFNSVKSSIIELVIAGKENDFETILNNKFSTMIKGKILSTYYPEKYLNIFSEEHLDYFLTFFGLDTEDIIYSDPLIKREELLKFKNSNKYMKSWSADVFSNFLYFTYPTKPNKKKSNDEGSNDLSDYENYIFPSLPDIEEIFQDIVAPSKNKEKSKSKIKNTSTKKTDYEKENRKRKQLGDRGEDIVLRFEKNRLNELGLSKLAKKVKRVSLTSDLYGYDIISFNDDGTERYIEVKATRNKPGDTDFYLSINEYNTSKELQENYFIYMVYDILSSYPKVWIIDNPFFPTNDDIKIEPINFKVNIAVE